MLMSVSMVVAPWRRFTHVARWNGQALHTTTGDARREGQPHPLVELQGRDHRQGDDRDGQGGRDEQPLARLVDRLGVVVLPCPVRALPCSSWPRGRSGGHGGAVAEALDRADERLGLDGVRRRR